MPPIDSIFNPYERKARLYPMIVALLPLALGCSVWLPAEFELKGVLGSTLIVVALASFLTQVARDRGKRCEPELFRRWGGRPSDRALSYRGEYFEAPTLKRRHKVLATLDSNLVFPASREEEEAEIARWKASYAAATELLLARTRDRGVYRQLFDENVNYGYRRNLWGLKPLGVTTALLGTASCTANVWIEWATLGRLNPVAVFLAAFCLLVSMTWLAIVTSKWPRVPAEAFARQLCEACDRLESKAG